MGTYCYALRKSTKKVHLDGEWQDLPYFDYSYKPSYWGDAKSDRIVATKLAAAERAFDHHTDGRFVVALDGEWVVLTRRDHYLDGETPEHLHTEVIGRVVKVGGRLHCVAQNTTVELAKNAHTYQPLT